MEINGDVTMETDKQTNKQPESENRASQQIDKGLLTFAIFNRVYEYSNTRANEGN